MTEFEQQGTSGAERTALKKAEIQAAVAGANIPPLLMLVHQFTGDEKWLGERYRLTRAKGLLPRVDGGLSEEAQVEVRQAAVAAVEALSAGARPAIDDLDADTAARLLSFFLGEDVDPRYGPMMGPQLVQRSQARNQGSAITPTAVPAGLRVIVVGLGLSGIAAIKMLQDLGVDDYTVFERGSEAGGVWRENKYPGAGVDTPSHLYTYSFAYRDWAKYFELQGELHTYFRDVLNELDAHDHVRFDTEVVRMSYDDETALWTVVTRTSDGELRTDIANIVISSVGALNRPRLPKVPGMDVFKGTQFHSTNWPEDVVLEGKRVAVVGAGASSQQITPAIVGKAGHVAIFQRSPQWVAPFELFGKTIPDAQRRLLQSIPLYHAWAWMEQFWQFGDNLIGTLRIDPNWPHLDRSVNARNDRNRGFFTSYIERQLEGRPDLLAKVVPDYPPFGKRILLDNGWYQALKRENVELITLGVDRVDETGLFDSEGVHHDVDVIVWATGFEADHFLASIDVYGEQGVRLVDQWNVDDPRAYLGVSIPHFPNFFMLGGPHSFPGSGSVMFVTELQTQYVSGILRKMFEQGITAVAAAEDVTQRYNDRIDEVHAQTVWSHPGFSTYYRNSKGRVVFVMPFTNLEYWEQLQSDTLDSYTQYSVPYVPASEEHVVGAPVSQA